MRTNRVLHKARKGKNDEFYTMLEDIEKELQHYDKHFNGKVVYCNCDNPETSNFTKYFVDNFERLGLKRLISSCYIKGGKGRYTIYDGGDKNLKISEFEGNGDFRSEESIELLKQSDIVVSNPAFSLFREYIAQLVKYDKKFLVIGNKNAITYKEIFPLFIENKLWFGYNLPKKFITPSKEGETELSTKVFGLTRWFTNLENDKENEELVLFRTYNEQDYPKFENYNAINIDKVKDIPCDYYGVMAVPVSFIDKYSLKQFEIVGQLNVRCYQDIENGWVGSNGKNMLLINGKTIYKRILIKRK